MRFEKALEFEQRLDPSGQSTVFRTARIFGIDPAIGFRNLSVDETIGIQKVIVRHGRLAAFRIQTPVNTREVWAHGSPLYAPNPS
jgi:hypothetical protein